jgi:hypothetical protein
MKSISETIQTVLYKIVPPSIGGIAYQVVTDTQHLRCTPDVGPN